MNPQQLYIDFMRDKVGPVVKDMARACGHTFDKIGYELTGNVLELEVHPKTGEISASIETLKALQGDNFKTVSPELKSALAHEIAGHVGHDDRFLFRNRKLSVFAGPIVAVTAYQLIKRALQENPSQEEAAKNIADVNKDDTGHAHSKDIVYSFAKYLAIGAIGLAGGSFIARHMSRGAEFAADKRAIEFTKNPEALVSALTKLHAAADEMMENTVHGTTGIKSWLNTMHEKFINATYHAHPSLEERIQRIRG